MEEKIWMEKLIELLNEAKPLKKYKEYWYRWNEIYLITYAEDYWASENRNITLDVISKSFWFIKWLVENDKIDFDNRDLKDRFMNEFERYPQFQNNTINREFNVNGLLMLLSISDTPIEDLISYLK